MRVETRSAPISSLCLQIVALCCITISCVSTARSNDRANIVLVLADDLGWTGLGCYGSGFYETPHIDKLASEGTRFTSAYSAAANCAPSRASIMSGRYTPAHGILYVGPGDYQNKYKAKQGDLKRFKMLQPRGRTTLPEGVNTLAETLKLAGYRTAMYGKWHLGTKDQHPSQRGFDEAIESHGKHFDFKTDPITQQPSDQYLSDFLSDQAAGFIKKSAAGDKPFFLYYADFLVHKPFEAKQRYLAEFGDKRPTKTQKSPMAAAMIKSLDDSVGKIMEAIDDSGVAGSTLFVFTSDNGGLAYEEDGVREENTSNLPLRGRKGSEYDGGIRVPWIVRWPGQTPAGVECQEPIHQIDLYPTFCKVAGAPQPTQTLHGMDLTALFRSPEEGILARKLYWYLPGYSAFHTPSVMVRQGKWKLIRRLESEQRFLYDTDADIGEATDLSSENAELATSLDDAAMSWLDDLQAPRMTPNPEYDPRSRR